MEQPVPADAQHRPDQQAVTKQTAFADHIIAGLSEVIGLRDGQPQTNYQDFLHEEEEITAQFYFKRKPMALADIPTGKIRLANAFDRDDTPNASRVPGVLAHSDRQTQKAKWMILSQGAGFSGGTAAIRVSGPDGLVLSSGRDERLQIP